jgi:H+-transporting ATPase
MLMLITLLNDGTMIAIGYDNAQARESPEKWNLRVLFTVSSVLAAVSCLSSLILLYLSLSSWESHNVYQAFGLGGLSYGQITTTIYLKVSVSDFLTLFSARTGPNWFWTTPPAGILVGAAFLALATSTILAIVWPDSTPDNVPTLGLGLRKPYELVIYIWIYCIVWWFVQDAAKVGTYYLLAKYDIFGYNDTGKLVLPESTIRYIAEHKEKDLQSNIGGQH